jgi:4-amino-4-deoxy-L-arabinose transferase-like glycosyltransferase
MLCGVSERVAERTLSVTATPGSSDGVPRLATKSQRDRRGVWSALALATLVAAGLRLPFLGHQSLWLDEIYTRQILREPSLSGLWRHVEATESTPPLYYLLGWLTHARSAVAMRSIPALALIAAVPTAYLAFRRLVGSRSALATASILAVSPMLVWYSTDARSYGLFVLTALVSLWMFSALLEHPRAKHFALWTAASAVCVWTHYFGVFLVGAEALVLLAARPSARRATTAWAALLALCLAALAPLIASQSSDERAGFIAGIPLSTRVTETVRELGMGPNVPRTWLEAAGLALFCLAVGAGIVIALRAGRGPRALLALAAIVFAAPLLLAILGIEDRFYARNMIAMAPLAVALAAPAMLRLRAAPLALYLVLASVTSLWVASDWRYEQVDWRGALARAQRLDSAAAIVAVTRENAPVVETYLTRAPASPAGVQTTRAWIIVEPIRTAGQRALGPAPIPTLPGFAPLRTVQIHAFTLVLVAATRPTSITPREIPHATVFAAPAP